jgi:hypothetical protein
MLTLASALLRERFRKLSQHYGWSGYASAGLMLFLFGWAGSASAAQYVKAGADMFEILLIALWTAWSISAACSGKDLSWRISLERILVFPLPGFLRLYTLAFVLGFLSSPLLVGLFVVQFCAYAKSGISLTNLIAVWIGYLLFVASVRLSASLAQVALHRGRLLEGSHRIAVSLAGLSISAFTLASSFRSGIRVFHPGYLFNLVVSGEQLSYPLFCMGVWVVLLALVDFGIQRELIFSGFRGPLAPGNRMMACRSILMLHPTWPGPLFRIGVCGWLRSRSAFLLFVWGTAYSFLWTYFSKPDDVYYFFLFIWMNLLFHTYLRGNLLGTDGSGVWIYYMFPSRIDRTLSSKSLSLSLLQGCMVASLLAAGLFRADTPIGIAAWGRIASYAISGILFGEICGFFFSVLYPDSIDRSSQFDGGTTVGALVVPVLQILFLFFFMLVSGGMTQFHSTAKYWGSLLTLPSLLFIARFAVLTTWVHKAMLEKREIILKRLAGQ